MLMKFDYKYFFHIFFHLIHMFFSNICTNQLFLETRGHRARGEIDHEEVLSSAGKLIHHVIGIGTPFSRGVIQVGADDRHCFDMCGQIWETDKLLESSTPGTMGHRL
jgi:hypothetical protein